MENNKTQQFARFFIKDLKNKSSKIYTDNPQISELKTSTPS